MRIICIDDKKKKKKKCHGNIFHHVKVPEDTEVIAAARLHASFLH